MGRVGKFGFFAFFYPELLELGASEQKICSSTLCDTSHLRIKPAISIDSPGCGGLGPDDELWLVLGGFQRKVGISLQDDFAVSGIVFYCLGDISLHNGDLDSFPYD
jgi:hypothetical protein